MKIALFDIVDSIQPMEIFIQAALFHNGRNFHYLRNEIAGPRLHQFRDADPTRIIPHFDWPIEFKLFVVEVEIQIEEGIFIAVKEGRRLAPDDAVKRGDALLTVQQQPDGAAGQPSIAFCLGLFSLRLPHQQAAYWITKIKRAHQFANLSPPPNIAALKLRQGNAAHVNLIQYGIEFHACASIMLVYLLSLKSLLAPPRRLQNAAR